MSPGPKISPFCEISLQSYGFFVSITIFGLTVPDTNKGDFPECSRLGSTNMLWFEP